MPFACAALHRRLDDVDLLAAEVAAVARMRVERGHRDARRIEARRLQRGVGEPQRGDDAVDGQELRHLGHRHVRRHARVPQAFEDVELGRRPGHAEHARREADLVVVAVVGHPHRLLVERREADGRGFAVRGALERVAVVRERERAALARRHAALDRRRVEVMEVDEHRPAGTGKPVVRTDDGQLGRHAGDFRTRGENAQVADDRDARGAAHVVVSATTFAVSSGLMPAGSPIARAISGSGKQWTWS